MAPAKLILEILAKSGRIFFIVSLCVFAVGLLTCLNGCRLTKRGRETPKNSIFLKNEHDSTHYFKYNIIYPDSVYIPAVAHALKKFALKEKKQFLRLQPSDTSKYHVTPYELRVEFKNVFRSARLTSYLANAYRFTGGAHGTSSVKTFTYDIKKRQFIGLKDLLQDTTALQPMSRYAMDQIARKIYKKHSVHELKKFNKEWVKRGAGPLSKNFSVFFPARPEDNKPSGLVIIFSSYQVGPHYIGMPHIFIPDSVYYSALTRDYQSVFYDEKP
ncbi:MAG TPA: DUF4163 domain-containing protein [Balneolaceae bacterium]|nr:DUF4163 domain-containing protein [Balneolaceae bacterium]